MAPPETAHILNDCGASYLFFGEDFLDTALHVRDNVDQVINYISLGEGNVRWAENYHKIEACSSNEPTGFQEPIEGFGRLLKTPLVC